MARDTTSSGLLRIPPFPGAAAATTLTHGGSRGTTISDAVIDRLIEGICKLKVGGTYWGAQPALPPPGYTLVRLRGKPSGKVSEGGADTMELAAGSAIDPWHVLSGAATVVVDAEDELALLAAMAGTPVQCVGKGRFADLQNATAATLRKAFRTIAVDGIIYRNPFSGAEIDVADAVELCGFWRRLIDRNRSLTAAVGFALWKRPTVSPLLWGGTHRVPFSSGRRPFRPKDQVAVWKSRTGPKALEALQRSGATLLEVEDGFIRSAGLGADCVPPQSIVLDSRGIYFDPNRTSDLEDLLQHGTIEPEILLRARELRELIVELGISKYGSGSGKLTRRSSSRHLLVPGQVEDDRAVLLGLGPQNNLDLLRTVRQLNPDCHVIYKPHPDVEAGHRKGAIPDHECLRLADQIVRSEPITSLIDLVDEVHVNTSLAGFEALLREKSVFTYGVPFYSGWGLTHDFGPVPTRRTARRSIDELVAAALLLYPRYLDPLTGLPCPAEILVRRIAEESSSSRHTQLVRLRRMQGRWKQTLSSFWPDR